MMLISNFENIFILKKIWLIFANKIYINQKKGFLFSQISKKNE